MIPTAEMGPAKGAASPTAAIAFERILVGLDYDESATRLLQVAAQLAAEFGSKVFVVHSYLPPPSPDGLQVMPPALLSESLKDARERLNAASVVQRGFNPDQWDLSIHIENPERLILSAAAMHDADLILLGHARRGVENLLLGSVSEVVLSRAKCSVLIVGPECQTHESLCASVLFATDLENTGIRAAEYAASLAAHCKGDLVLLHVMDHQPPAEDQMRTWLEDSIRERLCRLLPPAVLKHCRHQAIVVYGDASQQILAAADAKRASMIVLGVGHHKLLADHMPWRTVAHVIATAKCPVLNVASDCK